MVRLLLQDYRCLLDARDSDSGETERFGLSRFTHDTIAQHMVALAFSLEQGRRTPASCGTRPTLDLVDVCPVSSCFQIGPMTETASKRFVRLAPLCDWAARPSSASLSSG